MQKLTFSGCHAADWPFRRFTRPVRPPVHLTGPSALELDQKVSASAQELKGRIVLLVIYLNTRY